MKKVWILVVFLVVAVAGCSSAGPGSGIPRTDLGKKPSPPFTLTNQDGKAVSLGDLRGRAVALTFLYTSCPDVCPIVTTVFGSAFDRLGPSARKAAFVAVSVDPERDTPARITEFLGAQGLRDKMLFLTGSRPELEPIWAAYYVGVAKGNPQGGANGFYYVTHSNLLYLIDVEGRQRYLLKSLDFTVDQLLTEMQPLLAEAR